ncbi:MAG: hypothetical protein Q9178_003117 [Gyalolechia marmorata]
MPSDSVAAVSAFVEGAPPGELGDVIAVNEPTLLDSVTPAFQKYNEEQLTTTKLPGSSQNVLISTYNSLEDGRYYDKASDVQPYVVDSEHNDLITSLLKSLSAHSTEHYPSATYTVCPHPSTNTIALLLVSNKYSPSNFWNGRYRSTYLFTPSSHTLTGTIHVDVHYYEDGNVRLTTTKKVPEIRLSDNGDAGAGSSSAALLAAEVLRKIAGVEREYQEELNKGFMRLSEGEFKGLRRQLPVTRQKVEWEKIGGYRTGKQLTDKKKSIDETDDLKLEQS